MGTTLQIHTLGSLTISIDDTPVTGFDSRKVQALLVYIACTQRTYPREVLAELFWEERAQGQASANLRVALTSLRQTVEPFVEITRESVGLKEGAEIWPRRTTHLRRCYPPQVTISLKSRRPSTSTRAISWRASSWTARALRIGRPVNANDCAGARWKPSTRSSPAASPRQSTPKASPPQLA